MTPARPDVAALLRTGRLLSVPADADAARARLVVAAQHRDTARRLLDENLDLEIAYVALYDAARKAVTAAMLAAGVRAANRAGAHEAVSIWAAEVLGQNCRAARRFDALRRRRNRSEYDDLVLGPPTSHSTSSTPPTSWRRRGTWSGTNLRRGEESPRRRP